MTPAVQPAPRPPAPTVHSGFAGYERHYESMGNQLPDWAAADREPGRFASQKPWLPADRDARILDFGCGWGHQLLGLWCAGYRALEGVELVAEQARVAREGAAGRFVVHCADGRDFLSSRPSQYDLVVLNDVIEHVPVGETVSLLQVIQRALRPGGRIVVRTPNMASLLAGYSRYMDATHLTGFTEFSLTQVLEQAGFREIAFVPDYELTLRLWPVWSPFIRVGFRARMNAAVHVVLYALRGQTPRATRFEMNLEAWAEKAPA